ncbi:MAG TPA: hypothetical protein ENN29_08675 [Candidatus Hydrogenedentes bacterium]|nr:hypothetical protein [Candidatus Hydrogenedentota bacterium]
MFALLIALGMIMGGAGDAAATAPAERDAWQPAIRAVFEQLNTLDMFALATRVGGLTVKVPKELQALPMRMIESADELREHNIEIHLKELQFRDLNFIYDKTAHWTEERPLVPTTIEFGALGIAAEAKTRRAVIPLGATFQDGKLPVDFLPMLGKGFDLNMLPENRPDDVLLDNVQLRVGGPVASGIANRFFSKRVARLILEHGMGQTLQMGKGDLITGDAALRLLDVPGDSRRGRAVETLIDALK